MECDECGHEFSGQVCLNCGLVVNSRPIAINNIGYDQRRSDITTLYSVNTRSWEHPLSPNIRKEGRSFVPRYQKNYQEYIYVKAYESISKMCAILKLPDIIRYEALNLFKGIRCLDEDFFKHNKLAPTYLACIKIGCKIHDFPISNHSLALLIDYESDIDTSKNVSYMEKKFNRSYQAILKIYNLTITEPEYPNFISYACNVLGEKHDFTTSIYHIFRMLKKFFQPHFRIEGYILAIIYWWANGKYTLKDLEVTFHTSSITISNRKNEILKHVKKMYDLWK